MEKVFFLCAEWFSFPFLNVFGLDCVFLHTPQLNCSLPLHQTKMNYYCLCWLVIVHFLPFQVISYLYFFIYVEPSEPPNLPSNQVFPKIVSEFLMKLKLKATITKVLDNIIRIHLFFCLFVFFLKIIFQYKYLYVL